MNRIIELLDIAWRHMNRDCKATIEDNIREEIERVLSPKLQIELGKFYKRNDGKVVGPAYRNEMPNEDYRWMISGRMYRDDGTNYSRSEFDITGLASAPTSASPPTIVVVPDLPRETGSFTVKCDVALGSSVAFVGSLTDELRAYCMAQGIAVVDGKVERE